MKHLHKLGLSPMPIKYISKPPPHTNEHTRNKDQSKHVLLHIYATSSTPIQRREYKVLVNANIPVSFISFPSVIGYKHIPIF